MPATQLNNTTKVSEDKMKISVANHKVLQYSDQRRRGRVDEGAPLLRVSYLTFPNFCCVILTPFAYALEEFNVVNRQVYTGIGT